MTSEFTSLRVKKTTRDKIMRTVLPGETIDEALNDLYMFEKDESSVDAIKKSLDEKAKLRQASEGKALWRTALKESVDASKVLDARDAADKRQRGQ